MLIFAGLGVLFLFILLFAFLAWKNAFYYVENDVLFYQKGVLSKSKQGNPALDKITTINENQELIERIFRLSTFKVDAGSATKGNESQINNYKKRSGKTERRTWQKEPKGADSQQTIIAETIGSADNDLGENGPADHNQPENEKLLKTEYHISVKELILYAITSNSFFCRDLFLCWRSGNSQEIFPS